MSAQADTNCHDIFNIVLATRTHLAKIGAKCHVVPTCRDMSATFPAKSRWDTSSLAKIQLKDVQLSWSFVGDWLGSWSTTLGLGWSNRFQMKGCGRVQLIGWSPLQTMPGNGRVELSFVMQTRSTSSISARENVARIRTYCACDPSKWLCRNSLPNLYRLGISIND